MNKLMISVIVITLFLVGTGLVEEYNRIWPSDIEAARNIGSGISSHLSFIKTATRRFLRNCDTIDNDSMKEYFLYYGASIRCPKSDGEYNKYVNVSGYLRSSSDRIKIHFSFDKKTVKYKATVLSSSNEVMIEEVEQVNR